MVSSIGFCCDSCASRHTLLSPPPHPFLHLNHRDFFQFRGVLGFREGNSASTRVPCGSGQRRHPQRQWGQQAGPGLVGGSPGSPSNGEFLKIPPQGLAPNGNCRLPQARHHPRLSSARAPQGLTPSSSPTTLPVPTSSSSRLSFCLANNSQEFCSVLCLECSTPNLYKAHPFSSQCHVFCKALLDAQSELAPCD